MCANVFLQANEWNVFLKLTTFSLNGCWYDAGKQTNKQLNLNECFYSWDKIAHGEKMYQ